VAFTAASILVISGAFYIRGELAGGEAGKGGTVRSSQAPFTGEPGEPPPTRPAVVEPVVKVATDTDPLNLGSEELKEIYGRNQDWLVPRPQVVKGDPRTSGERPAADFYRFVKARSGVSVNRVFFSATMQNLTGGAVYLRSVRVTDLKCAEPLKGTRLWSGGGADPLTPRAILIDLDAAGPTPLHFSRIPEEWLYRDSPSRIDPRKAKPFGFTLAEGGTESFDIVAVNFKHRSCDFKLAVTAVLNGRSSSMTIDDGGRPFRVTGDPDNDIWMYNPVPGSSTPWSWPGDGADGGATRTADQPLLETDI
jgi:hypothetical protein